MAFDGNYDTAAAAARKLVNAYPSYGDARILLGRILAWQKDYDHAAAVIDTLLMTEPNNADALSAKRDITLWSKENTPVSTDIRAGYSFRLFPNHITGSGRFSTPEPNTDLTGDLAAAGINIGNLQYW